MKNTAIFINIGRGMTTKLNDLNDALRNGSHRRSRTRRLRDRAVCRQDHPLWDAPNTILTPHIAADEGRHLGERRYEVVADNMRRFAAGEPLRNSRRQRETGSRNPIHRTSDSLAKENSNE